MALPPVTPLLAGLLLLGAGLLVLAVATKSLFDRRRDRSAGALVAIDAGAAATLRSARYRLTGRPDAVRQLPDGRWIPVERKSRASPPGGPPYSHVVQVWAYCLLVEETRGIPPPWGLLRYADGGEFRIPWDRSARSEILDLRRAIDRPYDGRASPAPGKCARCRWGSACDARATGA